MSAARRALQSNCRYVRQSAAVRAEMQPVAGAPSACCRHLSFSVPDNRRASARLFMKDGLVVTELIH
jgi:hypothetical protein